jgi:DNA-binding MarR family transcriptional regulator
MNKRQDLPWDNPRFRNWIALVRAEKAVVGALTKALQPLDLKIAQLDMLMNLYRHPGMSQHELARKLLVGRSNITMLLPQMETRGLLRRENDAKDKRITRLIERVMAQSSAAECDKMGAMMMRISEMMKAE